MAPTPQRPLSVDELQKLILKQRELYGGALEQIALLADRVETLRDATALAVVARQLKAQYGLDGHPPVVLATVEATPPDSQTFARAKILDLLEREGSPVPLSYLMTRTKTRRYVAMEILRDLRAEGLVVGRGRKYTRAFGAETAAQSA